eukprot:511514_1
MTEGLAQMGKIVKSLLGRADCAPFTEPVQWRDMELWDYPKVIKVPMDLGTVSKKLESKAYKNATECANDIRLIWSNCKLYNQEGSEFFDLAIQLERRFEERVSSVSNPNECVPGFPEGGKLNDKMVPLDEKMKFCFELYRMSREDLGRLIVRLEQICPEAIERIGEEDIELNVDTMSFSVFTEMLNLVVKDSQLDTSGNNKRRKKGGSSGGGKANRTRS